MQTISLGTAGTQSGDKVRDAFNIVNQNFQNFQLNDLKGFYKFFDASGWDDVISTSWDYSSAVLSSIPAGTYIALLSAMLESYDGNGESIPVMGITDGSNNDLGIQFIGGVDNDQRTKMGMVQITKSSTFSVRFRFKVYNYQEGNGARFSNVCLLLLRVA